MDLYEVSQNLKPIIRDVDFKVAKELNRLKKIHNPPVVRVDFDRAKILLQERYSKELVEKLRR